MHLVLMSSNSRIIRARLNPLRIWMSFRCASITPQIASLDNNLLHCSDVPEYPAFLQIIPPDMSPPFSAYNIANRCCFGVNILSFFAFKSTLLKNRPTQDACNPLQRLHLRRKNLLPMLHLYIEGKKNLPFRLYQMQFDFKYF